MKSNDRLGDLHRTEEDIMDILHGLQENLGMDAMPTVIMTIGILYGYSPEDFMKRLGYSVMNAVENNPAVKNDEEAQLVMKLLRKELQDIDSKKKDSNIGYL